MSLGLRRRTVDGEHDDDQVRVGDHDVLAPRPARTGLSAAESCASRLDRHDGAGAVRPTFDRHPVADHGDVGALALLLQAAAELRLDRVAVIGLDRREAGTRTKHEPFDGRHPRAPTAMPYIVSLRRGIAFPRAIRPSHGSSSRPRPRSHSAPAVLSGGRFRRSDSDWSISKAAARRVSADGRRVGQVRPDSSSFVAADARVAQHRAVTLRDERRCLRVGDEVGEQGSAVASKARAVVRGQGVEVVEARTAHRDSRVAREPRGPGHARREAAADGLEPMPFVERPPVGRRIQLEPHAPGALEEVRHGHEHGGTDPPATMRLRDDHVADEPQRPVDDPRAGRRDAVTLVHGHHESGVGHADHEAQRPLVHGPSRRQAQVGDGGQVGSGGVAQ